MKLPVARHSPEVIVDITEALPRKREAMLRFRGTQARQGEDYPARLDRFFASVDGAAGYVNGFGYAERFTRWHPERVQLLPLASRRSAPEAAAPETSAVAIFPEPMKPRFMAP